MKKETSTDSGPDAATSTRRCSAVGDRPVAFSKSQFGLLVERQPTTRGTVAHAGQADRQKTEFLNVASHELRTPLTAILGYAELLEDRIGGSLTEQQAKFVGAILRSASKLRGVVDNLLDLAQIEVGKLILYRSSADVGNLIEDVVEHLADVKEAAKVRVRIELPQNPVRMILDQDQIGRVLHNLLTNAMKFNRPGGGVVVRVIDGIHALRVLVSDTGPGIPEEHRAAIFDRFYQVDSSHTRSYGGAGLGLSVANAVVRAHGGRLHVRSQLGKGSTFWFTLPRSQGEVEPTAS